MNQTQTPTQLKPPNLPSLTYNKHKTQTTKTKQKPTKKPVKLKPIHHVAVAGYGIELLFGTCTALPIA
jgi:hypothetical protein